MIIRDIERPFKPQDGDDGRFGVLTDARGFLDHIRGGEPIGDAYEVVCHSRHAHVGNLAADIKPNKTGNFATSGYRNTGQMVSDATRLADAGNDVWFCAHRCASPKRTAEDAIGTVHALWTDEDDGEYPRANGDGEVLPEPTCVVRSSADRRHLWWRTTRPISVETAYELNRRIALLSKADAGKAGGASLLRLPDTLNYKRSRTAEEADPVTAYLTGADAVDPDDLDRLLPTLEDLEDTDEPTARAELNGQAGDVAAVVAELACEHGEGGRHDLMLNVAGVLVRRFGQESAMDVMRVAWPHTGIGRNVDEAVRMVEDSAAKLNSGGKVSGIPALERLVPGAWDRINDAAGHAPIDVPSDETGAPAFPLHVFPPELRHYVETAADHAGAPVDYVGSGVLAVLGSAVGTTRRLQLKPGWVVLPSLWMLLVGKSGRAKTPAFKRVVEPVAAEDSRLQRQNREQMRAWKANKKNTLKSGEKTLGESAAPKPIQHRVMVQNATTEALMEVQNDNPRGVLSATDELSGWAGSFNQYKGGKGDDRQAWLSFWSSTPAKIDRKGLDEPLDVQEPFVSVFGGIQPSVLGDLGGARADGMMPRFLFVFPPHVRKPFTLDVLDDPGAYEFYSDIYRALRRIDPSDEAVRLADDAKAPYVEYVNSVNDAADAPGTTDGLREMLVKLPEQCARIALILSQIREPGCMFVERSDVVGAVELARYFEGQARRVHAHAARTDTAAMLERYTLALLRHHDGRVRQTPEILHGMFPEDLRGNRPEDLTRELRKLAARVDGIEFVTGERTGRGSEQRRVNTLSIVSDTPPPKSKTVKIGGRDPKPAGTYSHHSHHSHGGTDGGSVEDPPTAPPRSNTGGNPDAETLADGTGADDALDVLRDVGAADERSWRYECEDRGYYFEPDEFRQIVEELVVYEEVRVVREDPAFAEERAWEDGFPDAPGAYASAPTYEATM